MTLKPALEKAVKGTLESEETQDRRTTFQGTGATPVRQWQEAFWSAGAELEA